MLSQAFFIGFFTTVMNAMELVHNKRSTAVENMFLQNDAVMKLKYFAFQYVVFFICHHYIVKIKLIVDVLDNGWTAK